MFLSLASVTLLYLHELFNLTLSSLDLPIDTVRHSGGSDLNLELRGVSPTTLRARSIFLSLVNLVFLSKVYKDIQQ